MHDPRFDADALTAFATRLLQRSDVHDNIARDVAEVLVDADLMGHTTHGLHLLASYLDELEGGRMRKGTPDADAVAAADATTAKRADTTTAAKHADATTAASVPAAHEPEVVAQHPSSQLWDGRRLPGPYLTRRAFDTASAMAATQGTGTVVIRRSHHIACLAAYLPPITARGQMGLVYCSDPNTRSVAPFGGITPAFSPNPFAAGIPTSGDPILLDISASYTTNGLTARLHQAGARLPHPWLQDEHGNATDDPAVLFGGQRGTLLPLGGHDAGHKGYALALLVEALTAGLAGMGRADPKEGWGATVMVQVIDAASFGGAAAMRRQMDFIVDECHAATPRDGVARVRLPGERALKLMREQRAQGVVLYPTIMPALAPWAQKLGVAMPEAVASGT